MDGPGRATGIENIVRSPSAAIQLISFGLSQRPIRVIRYFVQICVACSPKTGVDVRQLTLFTAMMLTACNQTQWGSVPAIPMTEFRLGGQGALFSLTPQRKIR